MQSKATTVKAYVAELPPDRREAISAVREVILRNLPKGYAEGMQYGMIGTFVPHSLYPDGYHCDPEQPPPFAGLASQKNHMSLYLMCRHRHDEHEAWFRRAWKKTGKKPDMGKSCVRFKRLDDLPLDIIGEAIRRVPVKAFAEFYKSTVGDRRRQAKKTGKKAATPAVRPKKKARAGTSTKKARASTTTGRKKTSSGSRKTKTGAGVKKAKAGRRVKKR